ncbi:MAG: hypothetical protein ACFFAI_00945 [Promethearchaeota archaeon]
MNIKKSTTLGLILILIFPMLYLPLSVNSAIVSTPKDDSTKIYNPYNLNTVVTIGYIDDTYKVISTINGKTSTEFYEKGEFSGNEGLVSPVKVGDDVCEGCVGAEATCYKFDVFDGVHFKFYVWCEPKPAGWDNIYDFGAWIKVSGVTVYEYYDQPYDPNPFGCCRYKSYELHVVEGDFGVPISYAGRHYVGHCYGQDDDSYDWDLFDGESESASASCSGTITPIPYHSVSFGGFGDPNKIIYDDEIAQYNFMITNNGYLTGAETFHISFTPLSFATSSITGTSFTLSPGESDTFSITMDPTAPTGFGYFDVKAQSIYTSDTITCSLKVNDDDIIPPNIKIEYLAGDYTDGNPGFLNVTALDASGLFLNPSGLYAVSNSLGPHSFHFKATDDDYDNNRADDRSTITADKTIIINDDDTNKPYFENVMISDDHLLVNISFNGLDIQEGDDSGLSIIEVYIDEVLIHTYFPTPVEDTFNFSFVNEWIFDKGVHDIRVTIVDADDDRPDDALDNEFSGTFEVSLGEMYDYVIWQIEELKIYVDENLDEILSWGVRFLLWLAQDSLIDAYDAFIADEGVSGLVEDKFAQALTHITGFVIELFNNWDMISDEDAEYIIPKLYSIRNDIVFLMGESVGVEQSINIAAIEIELLNLNDFIDEKIDEWDSFILKSSIAGGIVMLEGALFKIVLDLGTECMLTGAQVALDHALTEVDNLLNSAKISQELADTLKYEIMQIQVEIETVKNSA